MENNMGRKITYYPSKVTAKRIGVCAKTLREWADKGKIKIKRTAGRQRRYDLEGYLQENNLKYRTKVCYCRVSSYDQKEDLQNQIDYLSSKYPQHTIVSDIGSGINFKRKGLKKIIDLAIKNELEELIITYKDRLCRIGYELIEHILTEYSSTKIIVENEEFKAPQQEITEDLIEIITVYSSRLYGSRTLKKR